MPMPFGFRDEDRRYPGPGRGRDMDWRAREDRYGRREDRDFDFGWQNPRVMRERYGEDRGYGERYEGGPRYGEDAYRGWGGLGGYDRLEPDRDRWGRGRMYGRGYGEESGRRFEDRDSGRMYGRGYGEERRGEEGEGLLDRLGLDRLGERMREGIRRIGRGPKGFQRSDERIREEVSEAIARSGVNAEDVEVHVKDGEVTLTGTLDDRRDKRAIEDIAESVWGVKDVHNQIRMRRTEDLRERTGVPGRATYDAGAARPMTGSEVAGGYGGGTPTTRHS